MKDLKSAVMLFVFLTLLVGGMYPAAVTVAAQFLFPRKAQGGLIADEHGRIIGSELIGQPFTAEKYFWPRPSASGGFAYNPQLSSGSNLGATNPELLHRVGEQVDRLRRSGIEGALPADLVTASASGLDPNISPEAAMLQVPRVAKARGMSSERLKALVDKHTEERQAGILGMPRVNVVAINLALDRKQL